MASAEVVGTSVTNNSPSQDSKHPDDLFQSRYYFFIAQNSICGSGQSKPPSSHHPWMRCAASVIPLLCLVRVRVS